ncbi:hypothetical protein AB0M02_41985 [Actinoplanes sp. NPDC051861]|uniref:hypothetical protein n=1 Tax=Actinoplanes sp. NPDC051861 TaxID=3155170 RepID=UPI00343763F9
MSLQWWSQPFAPEGSAAAEGIVKQLGRPALDPLTVLVREAAQNSWDARVPGQIVDFDVDIRVLGDSAARWRDLLLPGPAAESKLEIEGVLRPESAVLVVSDRNTVGLGGPLRAGVKAAGGQKADFVQFLRNVGEPSDHEFGGGTYGFGKGIFYRLSRVGAILVNTRTHSTGFDSRRFMGAALGHSWYQGDRRFTGRHWWGEVGPDGIPDPVLGDRAADFSTRLSLPDFADGRTGTDIVVLGVDLGVTGLGNEVRERSPHEAATFLASSILWHLWPKMVPDRDGMRMRFSVGVDGRRVPVPAPEKLEDLAPFVQALKEIRDDRGDSYARTVPPKNAGSVAFALGVADRTSRRELVTAARPFSGPTRHIARMRVAELVVDYFEGPPHPDPLLSYAGVFRASEDADELFASAEPPTHDDWVSKGLSGSARGVVQGLRAFLMKRIDERLGFGSQAGGSGGKGLGQLAARLGSVIPPRLADDESSEEFGSNSNMSDGGDTGGPVGGRAVRGSRTSTGGKPRLVGSPRLHLHEGRPFLVAVVKVPAATTGRTLTAGVDVVVEGGGKEGEPPAGMSPPTVLQWQSGDGATIVRGTDIRIPAGGESDWYVLADYVPDAVIRFRIGQVMSNG